MFRQFLFSIFSILVILKGIVSYTISTTESIKGAGNIVTVTENVTVPDNQTEQIIVTADCNGCRNDLPGFKDFLKSQKIAHRLEYITQQLVNHLHIQNPSNGTPNLDALPDFLVEQLIHPTSSYNEISENPEEARPRQVVLFPEEETVNCYPSSVEDILCLRFKLSDELLSSETSSAVIWFNKQHLGIAHNESWTTFNIYELIPWNVRKPINQTLSSQQINDKDDWYQIDLGNVVRSWQMYKEIKQRTIMVSCNTCNLKKKLNSKVNQDTIIRSKDNDENCEKEKITLFENSSNKGIENPDKLSDNVEYKHKNINVHGSNSGKNERVPFLLMRTEPEKNIRSKRGVDCTPGQQECCREDLFVDFKMLSEDYRMIYYPSRFNAYVCRGNCYYHSFTDVHTPYAGLLTVLKTRGHQDVSLRAACCTPTKFSSLQVFYASDNSTIEQKLIPNVIVEACGCI